DLNRSFHSDLMGRAGSHYHKRSLLKFYLLPSEGKHTTVRSFNFLRSKRVLQPVKLEYVQSKKQRHGIKLKDFIFRRNYFSSADIRPPRRVKNLMILVYQFLPYQRFLSNYKYYNRIAT